MYYYIVIKVLFYVECFTCVILYIQNGTYILIRVVFISYIFYLVVIHMTSVSIIVYSKCAKPVIEPSFKYRHVISLYGAVKLESGGRTYKCKCTK